VSVALLERQRHWLEEFLAARLRLERRGPDVSRKLQGRCYWFPARLAEPGNGVASILPPTWPGDRAAANWPSVAAVRVAVEFRGDRVHQLDLFRVFYWIYRNPSEDRSVTETDESLSVVRSAAGKYQAKPEKEPCFSICCASGR